VFFGSSFYGSRTSAARSALKCEEPMTEPTHWYADTHATLGDRLAAAREAAGLEQADLASRLGVRAKTLRDWEDDQSEPRANRLQMLAALLGVSLRWLLTGQGDDVAPPSATDAPPQDAALRAALAELRQMRAELGQAGERMGRLEKSLRRALESQVARV